MMKRISLLGLTSAMLLVACVNTHETLQPEIGTSDKISLLESKRLACPESVLEAGASPEDCLCVEKRLYKIGQKPGAIKYDNAAPHEAFGGAAGKRDIAIGILRLDAFEHCGLFDPEHEVSKNL